MAEDSTQPPHATRFVETTRGILSRSQLAPLLAERVLRVLQDIEDGVFATRPLDESLLLDLHRNICGDLTSDMKTAKWIGVSYIMSLAAGGLCHKAIYEKMADDEKAAMLILLLTLIAIIGVFCTVGV